MSGLIIFPPKIEDDIELNSNFEMKLFCFFVDLRCSAMLVTVVALGELVSNGFILFKTEVALALNESCMLEMLEEKVVTSVVSDCSEDDEDTIKILFTGRFTKMRHVHRTHRVNLDWLYEVFTSSNPRCRLRYVSTTHQITDMHNKVITKADVWTHVSKLAQLANTPCIRFFSSGFVLEASQIALHSVAPLLRDEQRIRLHRH